MFDYLVENMKRRSLAYDLQISHGEHSHTEGMDSDHKKRMTLIQERQLRDSRCHELIQAITQKQNEIAKVKSRIKWERQRQTLKEILRMQSTRRTRILQEFQSLIERIETLPNMNEPFPAMDEDYLRATQATLHTIIIQELSRSLVADISEVVNSTTLDPVLPQGHGYLRQPTEELYNAIRQSSSSTVSFIRMANELKMSALHSSRQGPGEPASESEAAKLLTLFREHHLERVAQIDSVAEKILSIEQERGRLYTQMRALSQKREQDTKVNSNLQELDEAKAHLKGLLMALEFIQVEQENLVERVVSSDEQCMKLDEITKTARIADKRLSQITQAIENLIEMIRLHLQGILSIADSFSKEVEASVSQDLSLLSNLASHKTATIEDNSKMVDHLLEQSQQGESAKQSDHLVTWRSTMDFGKGCKAAGSATLSADRMALYLLEMKRLNVIRSQSSAATDNMTMATEQFRAKTAESMATSAHDLRLEIEELSKSKDHDDQHSCKRIRSNKSSSYKFGGSLQETFKKLIECDSNYQASFEKSLQEALSRVDVGEKSAGDIQALLEDYERLQTISGLADSDEDTPSSTAI
ncbi:hypothetical protein BGW38_002312 [Lunasporangiospora selenospora]|uniref:Uncharacterized protein n=1 Tax=Lunasporangiospora selenospora TaxID=979761 RepID=A0A9P6KJ73_9FUNG|nr:hypothetical protein BGW38_002312 [Lunasporangiospora selenospora]